MMYEWEKEQTAKSNTISILLLHFLKHKIAMDSAAWGEKFILETQSQWGDILQFKIIFFSRGSTNSHKDQWDPPIYALMSLINLV